MSQASILLPIASSSHLVEIDRRLRALVMFDGDILCLFYYSAPYVLRGSRLGFFVLCVRDIGAAPLFLSILSKGLNLQQLVDSNTYVNIRSRVSLIRSPVLWTR